MPFQKVMRYSWITQNKYLLTPFGGFFCTSLIIDTDEAICSDIDISKSESETEVHIRLSRDPGPGTSCWPGPAPVLLMVPPRCFPTPGPGQAQVRGVNSED